MNRPGGAGLLAIQKYQDAKEKFGLEALLLGRADIASYQQGIKLQPPASVASVIRDPLAGNMQVITVPALEPGSIDT